MRNILTLTLKTALLLSLRFLKILRGIRTLHVMTKGSIQKEDVTIINIYAPNIGFPRGLVSKEPACQRRRRRRFGFDPWSEDFWRRAWELIPVFLPGSSHGQRSLAGYSRQGSQELDTTEATEHTRTHAPNKGAAQYVRQMLTTIKGDSEGNNNSGGLEYPLSSMDRSSSKKSVRKHTYMTL